MATVGRRPGRDEHGFGLLEVILSLTILLLVLVASSYLVDNVVQQAAFNRQRVAAAELADQYLETTSNASLSSLQADISKDVLLTASPVKVGGVNYSVWSHLEWAGTGSAPSLCSSGNPPQVVRATMTVKWGNNQSMGETSIIDPPYGTVIPGDGFLSIQILGSGTGNVPPADTANLINVPVTVTPITTLSGPSGGITSGTKNITSLTVAALTSAVANGDTITIGSGSSTQVVTASGTAAVGATSIPVNSFTAAASFAVGTSIADGAWGGPAVYNPDKNGCVYLQEPLGKYSVSLASPSGGPTFIDYQENLTPGVTGQNPVTVPVSTAGLEATPVQFHYDEAGTVTLTPPAGPAVASGMPISVGNNALLPSDTKVIVPPGSSTSVVQLYPYSTGYSVWYGDCTTQGSVTTEEPTGATTFSLAPQGTATASISGLDTVTLTVTQASGGPLAPKITATVADPNYLTDGCSSSNGEVYQLTGISGSGTTYNVSTAILSQTYSVVVTDPNNSKTSAPITMVVTPTQVSVGATNYPTGTTIPISVL